MIDPNQSLWNQTRNVLDIGPAGNANASEYPFPYYFSILNVKIGSKVYIGGKFGVLSGLWHQNMEFWVGSY